MADLTINLGAWQARSRANGPGTRAVLWLQGCKKRCLGCVNQNLLPLEKRAEVPVRRIADKVLSDPDIEGVTYTGGEPMLQAAALAELSELIRAGGLSVFIYTGYTIEELRSWREHCIDRLLALTDILVDGPFVRERAARRRWRGSDNQRVHFLTDRYRHLAEDSEGAGSQVEFALGEGAFLATGAWPEGFLERLEGYLRR